MMSLSLANEPFHLLPERAVVWPRVGAVIVADLHLGKADVFRARGIPVPSGSSAQTLARLTLTLSQARALCVHDTLHLIVLGDFLHARESQSASTLDAIAQWRAQWPALRVTVIEGNHDRHARTRDLALSASLNIAVVDEPFVIDEFAFVHEPDEFDPKQATFAFAGHVHPCAVLRSAVDRARVPCFAINGNTCLLPAFGTFTGGYVLDEDTAEVRYAIVNDRILALPRAT